jgi:hypothetical protein
MTIKEAIAICKEFQKYRRGEPPYDGETPETHKRFDYAGKPLGVALDCLIKFAEITVQVQDMCAAMGASMTFAGVVKQDGVVLPPPNEDAYDKTKVNATEFDKQKVEK